MSLICTNIELKPIAQYPKPKKQPIIISQPTRKSRKLQWLPKVVMKDKKIKEKFGSKRRPKQRKPKKQKLPRAKAKNAEFSKLVAQAVNANKL